MEDRPEARATPELLVKSLPFDECEFKATKEDNLFHIRGYASIFNTKDAYNDIMLPGCYKQTLRQRRKIIKFMWQHADPFGVPEEIVEDGKGLWTHSVAIVNDTNKERMTWLESIGSQNLRSVDGMSVGFIVEPKGYDIDHDAADEDSWWPPRKIKRVKELLEFSCVTIPAHDDARLKAVQKQYFLGELLRKGGREAAAEDVLTLDPAIVSSEELDAAIGLLSWFYQKLTGDLPEQRALTPDEARTACANWRYGNTDWHPEESRRSDPESEGEGLNTEEEKALDELSACLKSLEERERRSAEERELAKLMASLSGTRKEG